jgi:hypothetical protein
MGDLISWRKRRSQLGAWMDRNKVTQDWLVQKTGLSRNTLTELCGDPNYIPRNATRSTIIKALRQVDPNVSASDFW